MRLSRRGFTLIETIVVIGIMVFVVVALVAVINYVSLNARREGAQSQLNARVREAIGLMTEDIAKTVQVIDSYAAPSTASNNPAGHRCTLSAPGGVVAHTSNANSIVIAVPAIDPATGGSFVAGGAVLQDRVVYYTVDNGLGGWRLCRKLVKVIATSARQEVLQELLNNLGSPSIWSYIIPAGYSCPSTCYVAISVQADFTQTYLNERTCGGPGCTSGFISGPPSVTISKRFDFKNQ